MEFFVRTTKIFLNSHVKNEGEVVEDEIYDENDDDDLKKSKAKKTVDDDEEEEEYESDYDSEEESDDYESDSEEEDDDEEEEDEEEENKQKGKAVVKNADRGIFHKIRKKLGYYLIGFVLKIYFENKR